MAASEREVSVKGVSFIPSSKAVIQNLGKMFEIMQWNGLVLTKVAG